MAAEPMGTAWSAGVKIGDRSRKRHRQCAHTSFQLACPPRCYKLNVGGLLCQQSWWSDLDAAVPCTAGILHWSLLCAVRCGPCLLGGRLRFFVYVEKARWAGCFMLPLYYLCWTYIACACLLSALIFWHCSVAVAHPYWVCQMQHWCRTQEWDELDIYLAHECVTLWDASSVPQILHKLSSAFRWTPSSASSGSIAVRTSEYVPQLNCVVVTYVRTVQLALQIATKNKQSIESLALCWRFSEAFTSHQQALCYNAVLTIVATLTPQAQSLLCPAGLWCCNAKTF